MRADALFSEPYIRSGLLPSRLLSVRCQFVAGKFASGGKGSAGKGTAFLLLGCDRACGLKKLDKKGLYGAWSGAIANDDDP